MGTITTRKRKNGTNAHMTQISIRSGKVIIRSEAKTFEKVRQQPLRLVMGTDVSVRDRVQARGRPAPRCGQPDVGVYVLPSTWGVMPPKAANKRSLLRPSIYLLVGANTPKDQLITAQLKADLVRLVGININCVYLWLDTRGGHGMHPQTCWYRVFLQVL